MNSFLAPDSPFMNLLNKMTSLLVLNILTLVCCIPIITVGASLAAMHSVLLKMVRGEEGYIVKPFFKAFKENFRQATPVWLIFLVIWFILGGSIYITSTVLTSYPGVLKFVQYLAVIIAAAVYVYLFPLVSRFENTVTGTIKNAMLLAVGFFPRTLGMVAITILAPVIMYFVPHILPLSICFGLTAPGYLCAMLYNSIFKKLEENAGDADPETDEDSAGSD